MTYEQVDSYCNEILTILMLEEKKLGFNEIDRLGKSYGFKFSRPTLNAHLQHLLKGHLIVKRSDRKSKLPLKPSLYSINTRVLYGDLLKIRPALSIFKEIDKQLNNMNFKMLAWRLLQEIYVGDLVLLRGFLKALQSKKDADKREVFITNRILTIFMEVIKQKLIKVSNQAKEEDIKQVIEEFDHQIERCMMFFSTRELPERTS